MDSVLKSVDRTLTLCSYTSRELCYLFLGILQRENLVVNLILWPLLVLTEKPITDLTDSRLKRFNGFEACLSWKVHLAYPASLQALHSNTWKQILIICF